MPTPVSHSPRGSEGLSMWNEINTASKKRQEKTRLSPEQSAMVTSATAEKPGFTFTIPATSFSRCGWCRDVVAVFVLASGSEIDLDIEIEQGEPHAILTSPHDCRHEQRSDDERREKRWQNFLDMPLTEDDGL